jgi:C-terminal processing protease CtpA/Prc
MDSAVATILDKWQKQEIKGLILDLRNNPGVILMCRLVSRVTLFKSERLFHRKVNITKKIFLALEERD